MSNAMLHLAALGAVTGQAIDGVSLLVLVVGAARGATNGLTGEVARVLSTVVALSVAFWSLEFVHTLAARTLPGQMAPGWKLLIAICAVLAGAAILAWLLRRLADRMLRLLVDQPANAVFGVVFGSARGALLIVALLFLASLWPNPDLQHSLFGQSVAGNIAAPAVRWLRSQAGELVLPEQPHGRLLPRTLPRRQGPALPTDEPAARPRREHT